jgi:hypothetical protein
MDEVIAATAYLDLFLRTIYEPALLKVFLKFILCAKIDEMSLLDTLIHRINFTTKVKPSFSNNFLKKINFVLAWISFTWFILYIN